MKNLKEGAKIHLMGICGTGMAALAGLLKGRGFKVQGSDSGCYPPMDQVLSNMGIPVLKGYDPRHIGTFGPDLVIIGNVIRADNPEATYVIQEGIPYMSFPQALGEFFLAHKRPLVVTGTHGKTTTSTLLVSALRACGFDPGFMIGGVPLGESRGFKDGTSKWFVVEGDEYDSSFFQKVSKFLYYKPFCGIVTSLEFDHGDIFSSLEEIKESFSRFTRLIPEDGLLVACSDWPTVMEVAGNARCRVITYGLEDRAGWTAQDIVVGKEETTFMALGPEGDKYRVSIGLPGRHNVLNCLAVMALCQGLGMDMTRVIEGLKSCKGVKRRQEIRGVINDILIIDDFAHHPRAVKETLRALGQRYAGRRLIAIFEPRTNTSRRAIFQDSYSKSFDSANLVFVRAVPDPEKAPEGDRFSSERLVSDLKAQGKEAYFCQDAGHIIEMASKIVRPGDVIVVLSNGPFENIHERLIRTLEERFKKTSP